MAPATVSKRNRVINTSYRKLQLRAILTLLWLRIRHPRTLIRVFIPSYCKSGCYSLTGCEYVNKEIVLFTTAK